MSKFVITCPNCATWWEIKIEKIPDRYFCKICHEYYVLKLEVER